MPENMGRGLEFSLDRCYIIPPLSRINSPVIPLLIPCYGRTSSAVRAQFLAGSHGGEHSFSAVSHPCGFSMHRGERRSAMLLWFENPVIFLFENIKVCHDCFYWFRKIAHAEGRMASSEWGTPKGPFAIRHSPFAKSLKTLKTARASYWRKLAWIWDRRRVRFR